MRTTDQTADDRAGRAEQEATREDGGSTAFGGESRAQSSVIAVVLLIGLTVAGATAVLVVGSDALSNTQRDANVDSAENALSQIDAKASRVASGTNNTEVLTVADSGDGETRVEPNAGYVNITMENETTGDVQQVLLDESLGRVVYEVDGEEIAFQGGGVWRKTGDGSRMISRPDVHYRGAGQESPTATVPLTLIKGENASGDSLTISDDGTELRFPIRDTNRTNPITEGRINMTVQSGYYLAWGDYLEQLTGGVATYDHDDNEVSIVLVSPRDRENIQQGLFQTGTETDLVVSGSGDASTVDSYNSSVGPYHVQNSSNGSIRTAGDILISSNGEVYGDLVGGGEVTIKASSAKVTGNVSYGRRGSPFKESVVQGWVADNASVNSTPPIRAYVKSRVDAFSNSSTNDNDEVPSKFTDDNLDFASNGNSITLPSESGTTRRYYIDGDLAMTDDQNLTFDTSNGDIFVAVENSITMDTEANISVEGENSVRFFILDDFTMDGQSSVYVPKDDATRLWVYGTPETDVTFDGNGKGNSPVFVGAIYAPSTGDGTGGISIDNYAEIYGGIVGGETDISQGSVHFDHALQNMDPLPTDETIPRVTHLHLSINRVEIAAD
jgi:predicted RNA-binding protein with TRAM domain